MADAKRDNNMIPAATGVLNSDGATITRVKGSAGHILQVSDGTTGSDNGPTAKALRDTNYVTTLTAVSEANGSTPVALYVNSSGELLIDST